MSRRVLLEVRDSVATVTLNHPDRMNAIDEEMREQLPPVVERLTDPAIRAVVITGSGRAFSAGGSVDWFEREWNTREFRLHSHRLSAVYDEIESLEKPVIAAINGAATGAGLQLALACDLRIASSVAKLGYREHHLALIPGHGGATRLVKLIGLSRAKQLYFAGDLVDAEFAERIGLVHRIVSPEELIEEAHREAATLAARAPGALGLAKKLLNAAADVDTQTGLALESLAQSVAVKTSDHREGVRAFREKRAPDFRGE
ncbi:MAG: enoyl-CoA hydratase/isomerase family protein [Gemmatimonadetes bacterium]|nr:enoyl-CoA hydratase/isomerase family protein [Gemmatimonadota bacterium]